MSVEFECRRCGKRIFAELSKLNICPVCCTVMQVRPQPKHWIFQFNPSVYRWFDRVKETKEPEQWLISQHVDLVHKDDLVAIWSSGQKAGVYALGQIITNPAKNPLNPKQIQYFDQDLIGKFQKKPSAYVEYFEVCLYDPLLEEDCNQDNVLMGLQVFTNPQGTNFRLTAEQWNKILEAIHKKVIH